MIQIDDVTVTVPATHQAEPDRCILDSISLELSQHRICFIGANGSGKSTLLRLLNGLRKPTTGTVLVNGYDTVKQASRVRSEVGFIFSDPLAQLLTPTPIEDIELSLRAVDRNRTSRSKRALELLRERGIERVAHQSIYDLSGGERQLVALISVLALTPSILVADEPTTLLDLRNTFRFRRTLAVLEQQVIFSTHDMEIAYDAERVIAISQGKVVDDGTPHEVIPAYRARMEQQS